MTNEKQQNRKTFIDCYRIGRSLEYMDRYDQEQAWKKLNSAIQRKRLHRRISYMSSVAAMVAIAFTSFYLWHGEDQAPAEKLADAQETVGQSGRPGVILSLSDGRRIDLSAREGKIGAGEEVVNHPENKQLFYAADQGGEKISRMNRLDVPQGAFGAVRRDTGVDECPLAFGLSGGFRRYPGGRTGRGGLFRSDPG